MVNGYSGQKFYTEGGIQFYNLLFTLGPILFLGCFDRDVTLEDTVRFPGLYLLGINSVFFNSKVREEERASRAGVLWQLGWGWLSGGGRRS